MTTEGMPSRYANDADAAEAWKHGRQDADRAHAYSEAYADGYSTRAQDLADGTAED